MEIPFKKIYLSGSEEKYIKDAIRRGHLSGGGFYTKMTADFLESKFAYDKALMTNSGTSALEMAAQLIDIKEGDQVIMPSFTFTSTANAFIKRGAEIVFSEIKTDTLNIDPELIEEKITEKTKAVVPVHYAGIGCDMDSIMELADKYGIFVIEDAAHALDAKYKGKYLGGIGDFACLSFHDSKNHAAGEGGALIINNKEDKFIKKAEIIRDKGTNRSDFMRGIVDKYTWVGEGSSYSPSEIQMAFLYAQLEDKYLIKEKRKKIHNYYFRELKEYLGNNYLKALSDVPDNRESNYHIFYLLLEGKKLRDQLLYELQNKGVNAVFHYQPLHSSPMGKKMGYSYQDFKVTNKTAEGLIRLPIYPDLKKKEMRYIVNIIKNFFSKL